jgi:hypothetical protein
MGRLESSTLVLAVWFACRSSTGSRRVRRNAEPNLRCPRNGKWTRRKAPLSSLSLSVFDYALGKAMEVESTSPDTGQHGGCARKCATVTLMHRRGRR